MYKFFLSFFIIATVMLFMVPKAYAGDVFTFYLYRTSDGTITLDESVTPPIKKWNDPNFSIIASAKEQSKGGPYAIHIYDVTGANIYTQRFNPPFGAFTIKAPYFSIASTYKISIASTTDLLLEGNLSAFSVCNANGICEFENGETEWTCLSDCASRSVTYSEETKMMFIQQGGSISDPESGTVVLHGQEKSQKQKSPTTPISQNQLLLPLFIFGGVTFLVVILFVIFWKKRHE